MPCALYLLTPPSLQLQSFAPLLAECLNSTDKIWGVQLRLKNAPESAIIEASNILRPIIQNAGAQLILNDHAELVEQTKADGVHLGQSDMPLKQARALLGAKKTIGITCHNQLAFAQQAEAGGADYVAFGAFYPSPTKATTHKATPALLRQWQAESALPSVAIGGITPANAKPLVQAGANRLAVSSGVWAQANPAQAVMQLAKLC